ncbi:MAG: hypothetical protein CMJ78_16600 [Planctomycetaceae bacterium]|nr:hypothetical protein [Planctomycetaceae bacterium]
MQTKTLGTTGLNVSRIAFGAGPIPELMTEDGVEHQLATMQRALDVGVNWIDTAATYGNGQSEASIGRVLHELKAADGIQVASKARVMPDDLHDIAGCIERSVAESLERLNIERLALLQLHNSITSSRGDEPTSLTPTDTLGPVLQTFQKLRDQGLVQNLGLTAIGQPESMKQVINSREFATIQVPYNLLNPSAGQEMPADFDETNYGNVIQSAFEQDMGVFAIRVFAGGALCGNAPAKHTYKTKFFPLDLYERDRGRADTMAEELGSQDELMQSATRFVLNDNRLSAAIIGFSDPAHVDAAAACLDL